MEHSATPTQAFIAAKKVNAERALQIHLAYLNGKIGPYTATSYLDRVARSGELSVVQREHLAICTS